MIKNIIKKIICYGILVSILFPSCTYAQSLLGNQPDINFNAGGGGGDVNFNAGGGGDVNFDAGGGGGDVNFNSSTPAPGLRGVLVTFTRLINKVIPIILSLGLLLFLVGVLRYAFSENEQVRKESRGLMTYGIVALFVMVSVWGLVALIVNSLEPSIGSDSTINTKPINITF